MTRLFKLGSSGELVEAKDEPFSNETADMEGFVRKNARVLGAKCDEAWKEPFRHFLEYEEESIKMQKELYENNVKKAKDQFADVIKKYEYLKPAFTLMNRDVLQ